MLLEQLKKIPSLLDNSINWNRYLPAIEQKDLWLNLEEPILNRLKAEGTSALNEDWPNIPTNLYLDFFRTGNRSRFETRYFRRRVLLIRMVQAYCSGQDTDEILDGIINALGSICEEFSWVVPAHNWPHSNSLPPAEPDTVDLFAANTASLLALTVHLLKEPLRREVPRLVDRISLECTKRCLIPYMENDSHWWMGFRQIPGFGPLNNWNPWITSNFLHTLFLISSDTYSHAEGTERAVAVLSHYLEILSPDGGCNEGPAYWNHAVGSLYDCLDIFYFATGGAIPLFRDEWFRKAASYIGRMHIAGDYFINFADCSGRLEFLPSGLIGRIGEAVNSREIKALSSFLKNRSSKEDPYNDVHHEAFSSFRMIRDLFFSESSDEIFPEGKLESDCFPDLQIGIIQNREDGLVLACKGGHNNESHNHNDVGQFIIYGDGYPLLIDPGVGDYTRETFNHMRYTIWTMQSRWHNLPQINGCDQKAGKSFFCDDFRMAQDRVTISMAEAYPEEAEVKSWLRELTLDRLNSSVTLTDNYDFEHDTNEICWSFIFLQKPRLDNSDSRSISIESSAGTLTLTWKFDYLIMELDSMDIPEDDHKMGCWGVNSIWRARISTGKLLSKKGKTEFKLNYSKKDN